MTLAISPRRDASLVSSGDRPSVTMVLTNDERILLENVLESLDRLFDRDSTARDLSLLLVATSMALHREELAVAFEEPMRQLSEVVRSKLLPDPKRDLALKITDGLRGFVAEQLHDDKKENPKQRAASED